MIQGIHHYLSKYGWLDARLKIARYLTLRDMDDKNITAEMQQVVSSIWPDRSMQCCTAPKEAQ